MKTFEIGQVVEGVRFGRFVVVGLRTVAGEQIIDVREIGPQGQLGHGEIGMTAECFK